VSSAAAGELVYTPINPTFGGSPLNSSQLMAEASAQKPSQPVSAAATQQSSAQMFMQMLQSQLYASLANQVANAIFPSSGSSVSGRSCGTATTAACTMNLGSMSVTWSNSGSQTDINMVDYTTGKVTEISVPQFSN
jgi:curli production assembly/transport component CsgF